MPPTIRSYHELKHFAKLKLIDFLADISRTGADGGVTRLAACRDILHQGGFRAYTEPILCDLARDGWIEVDDLTIRLVRPPEEWRQLAKLGPEVYK